MSSLAGRVSAVASAFLNKNTGKKPWSCFNKFSTLSLPKPLLPTPILTWKQTSSSIGLLPNNNPSKSYRWSNVPTALEEECTTTGTTQDYQDIAKERVAKRTNKTGWNKIADNRIRKPIPYQAVRKASVVIIWSILSLLTTFALCRLDWVDGVYRRGQEYIEPRAKQLKIQFEQARYWAIVSCILLFWLYMAFFLHLKIQQWEMSTMYPSSDAFDPGGSFCHSTYGLGCQLSVR